MSLCFLAIRFAALVPPYLRSMSQLVEPLQDTKKLNNKNKINAKIFIAKSEIKDMLIILIGMSAQ